jgi:two-component system, chemotaxis family, chemotaxis protein CheY
MRALVVDDSRAMRMILRMALQDAGFEVVEAEHGLRGLERLKEVGSIDLATVDWNMPEMNGLEFVVAVRKDAAHAATRLMMITTETEYEQMAKALDAGANEYLMKPFTKDLLLGKLELLGLRAG